jgi:putative phosphoserine phosphatase/1-acylglycerol-3-phosphate O-acyltransferase
MENISSRDSATSYSYIAFFDLDRTITKAVSGKALARGAIRLGLFSLSDIFNAFYLSLVYKLNLRDPLKIMDEMTRWVKGMEEKTMDGLCSEVFLKVLLPSVYSEARSEIKFHIKKSAKVVILSSALTQICREIAIKLDMDDIICSGLEVINGKLTGNTIGRLCFGEEKKLRLIEYCEKNNTNPADSWYYGDSISDLPALSIVGNPVCVNPDNKLRRAAGKRGWRILHWIY